jgi:hypothetical protein
LYAAPSEGNGDPEYPPHTITSLVAGDHATFGYCRDERDDAAMDVHEFVPGEYVTLGPVPAHTNMRSLAQIAVRLVDVSGEDGNMRQVFDKGLNAAPSFRQEVPSWPPRTIISVPVQMA